MSSTLIRAPWIIGFQEGEHRVLRDGCIVVDGADIVFVGQHFIGTTDHTQEYKDAILTPGLISMHAHMHTGPTDKAAREDVGNPQFGPTGLIEFIPPLIESLDEEGRNASVTFSIAEHLLGGCTTVMDMGDVARVVSREAERIGIRCYASQYFKEGMFGTDDGQTVRYTWDYKQGARDFDDAVQFVRETQQDADGLVTGFLAPLHADTTRERSSGTASSLVRAVGCPKAARTSRFSPGPERQSRTTHGATCDRVCSLSPSRAMRLPVSTCASGRMRFPSRWSNRCVSQRSPERSRSADQTL
jgi:5-methylthioadenosine/S-adenosylhomocysteine deaminase